MLKFTLFLVSAIYLISCVLGLLTENIKYTQLLQNILTRKKRFAIFPQGSAFTLTHAVTKHLIFQYPRSWMISLEVDAFYDLPTTFVKLKKPNKYKKQDVTQAIKSKISPMIIPIDFHHKTRIVDYSKASNWKDYKYPHHEGITTQKLSYEATLKNNPVSLNMWRKNMPAKYTKSFIKKYGFPMRNKRSCSTIDDKWVADKRHRERRQIFKKIESTAYMFGFNVKSCILRTICEVKHILLPPGKSLIQDIIRILFELPTDSHRIDDDDYIRSRNNNCRSLYSVSCPISIIEFLNHNQFDVSNM